jgi:SAM-dependent methyltransferase
MNNTWEAFFDTLPEGWTVEPPLITPADRGANAPAAQAAYRLAGGCRQRGRSKEPLEAGYYDAIYYRRLISRLVPMLPADPLCVDLGCGDGRGTELLADFGVSRIIVQDFNKEDLLKVWDAASASDQLKVLPVYAPIDAPALWPRKADAVLMMEVAYTLENPLDGYMACNRWLRKGGYALVSNIAVGGYFVHALLNRDWHQVAQIAENAAYTDSVNGHPVSVHLYTSDLMQSHAREAGFEVVESHMVSAGAGLLLHAFRQAGELDDHRIPLLNSVAKTVSDIPRMWIDILRKED